MKTLKELGAAPSPWSVRDIVPIGQGRDDVSGKMLVDGDGNDLVLDLDGNSIEEITATANLISAAPDLYECLSQAVSFISDNAESIGSDCDTVGFVAKCRAAIAKAAGESEAK